MAIGSDHLRPKGHKTGTETVLLEVIAMRDEYDFSKAKKGKKAKELKVIKTFRMDSDVIAWLEAQGEKQGMGYQTFLNWFLRKSMDGRPALEDRLVKLERAVFKRRA